MSSFDAVIDAAIANRDIPGAVMLASNKSGRLIYSKSAGLQSPASDTKTPYGPSTVLELASMTKLITSIAALQLVERGLVGLDQDISSLVPSFAAQKVLVKYSGDGEPLLEERRNPITLRHLLTHAAGAGYAFLPGSPLGDYRTKIQRRGLIEGATVDTRFDHPLVYQPGEGWAYSSSIDRAGQVVEKISGLTLEEYFRTNLFAPLGIRSGTFFPEAKVEREKRAAVTFRDEASGHVVEIPGQPTLVSGTTECFGGQGLYMSAEDYLKVLRSLLLDDGKLLGAETSKKMFEPQLGAKSKKDLLKDLEVPGTFVGNYPPTGEYDWGFGGAVVDGDSHGFRKKGALMWGGASNPFWFIDRKAGVCGIFGTQVYPSGDERVRKLHSAFEEEVYRLAADQ